MGVDITAISHATCARKHQLDSEWCFRHHTFITNPMAWLRDDLPEGCYLAKGSSYGFRAGSYSGYNVFLDSLCRLGIRVSVKKLWNNPEPYLDSPFVELFITPPQCAIGPTVSAKLSNDFAKFAKAATALWNNDGSKWLLVNFKDFQKAFRIARRRGFVVIH